VLDLGGDKVVGGGVGCELCWHVEMHIQHFSRGVMSDRQARARRRNEAGGQVTRMCE